MGGNMYKLKEMCQEYYEASLGTGCVDGDLEHSIFEEAMQVTLGTDVWERLRAGQKKRLIEQKQAEIERLRKELQ